MFTYLHKVISPILIDLEDRRCWLSSLVNIKTKTNSDKTANLVLATTSDHQKQPTSLSLKSRKKRLTDLISKRK